MATLSSIITPTNITTATNTQTLTNKTLTGAVMNGTLGATTPSTVSATAVNALSNTGGYQLVVGQLTGGDRLGFSGQASGTGTGLVFFDNSQTSYRPGIYDGSSHSFKISGVAVSTITSTGQAVTGTLSTTGVTTLGAYANVYELLEKATITASAPTATTNFDLVTQAVQYYTSNSTTNFTLNIRGNSTTTLNTMLAVGQSATFALMISNSTAYYPTAYTIDGTSVTPKWGGGTAPTGGNASSIDVYVLTVIKTASTPTYVVLANQTKYA
jgi:hypothetical protein